MNRKENAETKLTELGIYLLVGSDWEVFLTQDLIFPFMEENFPEIPFAVVAIEDDDELNDFAKLLPPKAFIFVEGRSFSWSGHSYSARDLLSRLISRFPYAQGVLMSGDNVFGEGDHYHLGKEAREKKRFGRIDVKSLLSSTFGDVP